MPLAGGAIILLIWRPIYTPMSQDTCIWLVGKSHLHRAKRRKTVSGRSKSLRHVSKSYSVNFPSMSQIYRTPLALLHAPRFDRRAKEEYGCIGQGL
ncbi:hypothetical protein BDV41DRAFT_521956 [Aspergillus transmontanensis]|uniref:Secreted protein n=1 Tax=Aspergillus transmontanensis TaxID=1034304 RepID=A0A5N6WD71_9EURO|nr:hypothetical protein BDV41DRAFT_521956 [Aspergillus transmontanensis]